ncbi:chemotaxis protein CheA [Pseudomonas turukhanskensis]|uniref:Chemotaxis protein CheA n=1 Tax=Pseudomonas turukhanskensis TaxID=1806536 RepID=A0A9W6NGL3_9PSED|nr:chemotaxis protein CheA [Pseudomonas turukhanskensis]GLK89831.1 chemotaxis protein CheA [Pseudomonas turukhanskensis]
MLNGEQWTQLLLGFIEEASELTQQAEEYLLQLDQSPTDEEALSGLFRAMHTIKGSAGLFSLTPLVSFTHHLENLLMAVRDGAGTLSPALISVLLRCLDEVASMVALIDPQTGELPVDEQHQAQLLATLAEQAQGVPGVKPLAVEPGAEPAAAISGTGGAWHISLRFSADLLRNGFDPAAFVRYLGRLGDISHLALIDDTLPALAELDPESCYLGLEIDLLSDASKTEIEDVFEFIRDFCTLHILPPDSALDDYLQLIQQLPESDARIGQILVSAGLLTENELQAGLTVQASSEAKPALGEVLVSQGVVPPKAVDAALAKQKASREKRVNDAPIRVAAHKLDELINLVGELVISAAGAQLHAQKHGNALCVESTQTVNQHVEQIREVALKMRMIEIGDTFNRFHRVVRDVSQQLGKDIRLDIRGADTELDKSVIDQLADPLTHLVRNAIDHGIENAEQRAAAGKPAQGLLRLNAYHESGMIVIEVSDDGHGLNTARIRDKAIARGLIDAQANLSEHDIQRLIFAAGFSTAEAVSDLSGRGVGMDVVRSAIDALRGSIDIDSVQGQGTTFRIRLPLTLAIIDGFLVSLGDEHLVVPLDLVTECIELDASQLTRCTYGYIELRGKPLPCIDLAAHFGLPPSHTVRRNIVVVNFGRQQAGLIVDHLHGELQTVIKPLGLLFQHLQGISGSTILGSGQIALILDIANLFHTLHHSVEADSRTNQPRPDLTGS